MKIHVNVEQLAQLAPRMRPLYRDTFSAGQAVLDRYGISASARRVAHFIGQVLHESQALSVESDATLLLSSSSGSDASDANGPVATGPVIPR